jgi:hypothetical protein
LLKHAEADVLNIMDCCAAATAMKNIGHNTRSYELMAAAGRDSGTPKPGPRSYTRAIMDSLKEELDRSAEDQEGIFTTFGLNQRIRLRHQWSKAELFQRVPNNRSRHIRLAPLVPNTSMLPRSGTCASTLGLQLGFSTKSDLKNEEVKTLARLIAKAAKDSGVGITSIEWDGFRPKHYKLDFWLLVLMTSLMKGLKRRRMARMKRQREDDSLGLPEPKRREHASQQGRDLAGVVCQLLTPSDTSSIASPY